MFGTRREGLENRMAFTPHRRCQAPCWCFTQPALSLSTTPRGCLYFVGTLGLSDGDFSRAPYSDKHGPLELQVCPSVVTPRPQTARHHTKGFPCNPQHDPVGETLLIPAHRQGDSFSQASSGVPRGVCSLRACILQSTQEG